VHWVAHRVATGETFSCIVAPEGPLAPHAPAYVRLPEEAIRGGTTLAELHARWRAFARETDVVCSWGRYATALFASKGAYLPPARIDLRQVARVFAKGKVGTLDDFLGTLPADVTTAPGGIPDLGPGRAVARLGQVSTVARYFARLANEATR
jgi:hypothetical protein